MKVICNSAHLCDEECVHKCYHEHEEGLCTQGCWLLTDEDDVICIPVEEYENKVFCTWELFEGESHCECSPTKPLGLNWKEYGFEYCPYCGKKIKELT